MSISPQEHHEDAPAQRKPLRAIGAHRLPRLRDQRNDHTPVRAPGTPYRVAVRRCFARAADPIRTPQVIAARRPSASELQKSELVLA
jgi:hypothetical protein